MAFRVEYVHQQDKVHGNILWAGKYPMRGGRFPLDHPCAGMKEPFALIGWQGNCEEPFANDSLGRFRKLGYEASCFPEGDGVVVIAPEHKTAEDARRDIHDCFGWEVTMRRRHGEMSGPPHFRGEQ